MQVKKKNPNTYPKKFYKTAIFDIQNYGVLIFKMKKQLFIKTVIKSVFEIQKVCIMLVNGIMNMHMKICKKISNVWRFIAKYSEKSMMPIFDLQRLGVLRIVEEN